MKKNTKAILIASGVAAASATVLVTVHQLTARGFMKMALDRKEPKILTKNRSRLMGSEELSNCMSKLIERAERLRAKNCQVIEINSHDGIKLAGHWYPCENPKRVVIAMHGWRSSWARDFGIVADFLHQNHCSVLFAEQRAQGSSEGEYMGFGMLERYDCFDWIQWVNTKTEGKLPIYLMGVSMGATTVMMTTGFELPQSVHGIVADCGFTSPHAIWKHVAENNLKIPFGIYSAVANDIFKKKVMVGSKDFSCTQALENCKVPVLFVHGTDDQFVPINMTFENYKACKADKQLFIVPGADHGMSYVIDKEGYEKKLLEFWERYD